MQQVVRKVCRLALNLENNNKCRKKGKRKQTGRPVKDLSKQLMPH